MKDGGLLASAFSSNKDAVHGELTQQLLLDALQDAWNAGSPVPEYTVVQTKHPERFDVGKRVRMGDDPRLFEIERIAVESGLMWMVEVK